MAQRHGDGRKTQFHQPATRAIANNHVCEHQQALKILFCNARYLHSWSLLTWSGMTNKGTEQTTAMNVCKESVLQLETAQEPSGATPVSSQGRTFGPGEGCPSPRFQQVQTPASCSQPYMYTSRPHRMEDLAWFPDRSAVSWRAPGFPTVEV